MKRILVLNGPNLDRLGTREPEIYGRETLADILAKIRAAAAGRAEIDDFQSADEGALVARILAARGQYDGLIFNPGAFTHESVALHDALRTAEVPAVEVHLSNLYRREGYRHASVTASACIGQICGFGSDGYVMALSHFIG